MTDKDALALCLWREARGEGSEGMLAVGCVIMNRVKAKWNGGTLQGVIFGKNQFTSMSVPQDSQYSLYPKKTDKSYLSAQTIADNLVSGDYEDITKGALWYANIKNVTSGWYFKNIIDKPQVHPETVTVNNHTFFS
jgi:N-acetylmuramoyl-L-alanine amidase